MDETVRQIGRQIRDSQTDRPEKLTCYWSVLFLDVQEMMHTCNTIEASQCIVWTCMNPCWIFSTLCCQFYFNTLTERPTTTCSSAYFVLLASFFACIHIMINTHDMWTLSVEVLRKMSHLKSHGTFAYNTPPPLWLRADIFSINGILIKCTCTLHFLLKLKLYYFYNSNHNYQLLIINIKKIFENILKVSEESINVQNVVGLDIMVLFCFNLFCLLYCLVISISEGILLIKVILMDWSNWFPNVSEWFIRFVLNQSKCFFLFFFLWSHPVST